MINESDVRAYVGSAEHEDLRGKEICYRCVLAGINVEDSLHDWKDRKYSPKTGDGICEHCHVTECDYGPENYLRRDLILVSKIVGEFEKLRDERLRSK